MSGSLFACAFQFCVQEASDNMTMIVESSGACCQCSKLGEAVIGVSSSYDHMMVPVVQEHGSLIVLVE